MSRNSVAGFMMGVSFGVIVGYFLKTPEEWRTHSNRRAPRSKEEERPKQVFRMQARAEPGFSTARSKLS